jgi:tetratricopeptide (TPR) repeat protein
MSRKTKNAGGANHDILRNYVLIAAVSAALGSGLTWLITAQQPNSDAGSTLVVPTPAGLVMPPNDSGPPTGQAAVAQGNSAYDHQRWSEAIQDYQQAIASGVNTADVHTDLGNAFRFAGQPQKALEEYQTAQKLNPQHENSLFNQISLFSEVLHDPGRAASVAEEFMRRFPGSDKLPTARQELARAKGVSETTPTSNAETRTALSEWLKGQQKQNSEPKP